jgi:hypothetical protein
MQYLIKMIKEEKEKLKGTLAGAIESFGPTHYAIEKPLKAPVR